MSLPLETGQFTDRDLDWLQIESQKMTEKSTQQILSIKVQDLEWRVHARPIFGRALLGLLIAQNIAVFGLVFLAFQKDALADLGIIFSVLVTATLAETAVVIKIIVQWLFSNINYKEYDNGK